MTGFPDQSTTTRQNDSRQIARLERLLSDKIDRIAELKEEVRQLREMLLPELNLNPLIETFALTRAEAILLHLFLEHPFLSYSKLLGALELAERKRCAYPLGTLRVLLCKMDGKVREKIGGGKMVKVRYGEGYWIGEGDKARIKAAMEGKGGACNGQQAGEGGRADRQHRGRKKALATPADPCYPVHLSP